MSEPLSKKLGISPIEEGTIVSGLMNGRECDAYIEGHNRAVRKLDQLSPDVEELAFLIYFNGIPSSNLEMARRLWKDGMVDCEKYRKIAQEIINSMGKWIKKGT